MNTLTDSQNTMRAAVMTAPGVVAIERVPLPQAGPGELRVRLEGCGVCASNLTPWSGPSWMAFPTAPGGLGHEGWGVVDQLGEGVAGYRLGDRVATLSCNSYAQFDLVEQAAAIRLPDALGDRIFPGEPLGCAMNIFRRSDIRPGQTVAVIGIGFLGAALTRLASDAGARVVAISRRACSLDLAREMGATETIPLDDHHAIIARVRALTDGGLCPRVIEAIGKQWPLDLGGELIAEGGRLVIAGYHQDGPRQVNLQLWNWRGIDVVNAHERDRSRCVDGVEAAIEAVLSGRLVPERLFTHRFPLEQLDRALNATRDRPDGFVKAVVIP
jgi:threonine dehydrogenase-like Zn-dependent dehydrogenase